MSFMGQKDEEDDDKSSENVESSEKHESPDPPSSSMDETDDQATVETLETNESLSEANIRTEKSDEIDNVIDKDPDVEKSEVITSDKDQGETVDNLRTEPSFDHVNHAESTNSEDQVTGTEPKEVNPVLDLQNVEDEIKTQEKETTEEVSDEQAGNGIRQHEAQSVTSDVASIQVSDSEIVSIDARK